MELAIPRAVDINGPIEGIDVEVINADAVDVLSVRPASSVKDAVNTI